jgi:small-conductance mechanosensitive channel
VSGRSSGWKRCLSIVFGGLLFVVTLFPAAAAQGIGGSGVSRSVERAPTPDREQELLVAVEDATARLAARFGDLAASLSQVAEAPAVLSGWLTQDGSDPSAPLRSVAVALVMILAGWLAQAAVGRATSSAARSRARSSPHRVNAGIAVLRGFAFAAASGVAHALISEASRPARLTSLAVAVIVVGTWMVAQAVSQASALFARPQKHRKLPMGLLEVGLFICLSVLASLPLLREAGVPADARLMIGVAGWLPFGALLMGSLNFARQPAAANDAVAPGMNGVGRFMDRHGLGLVRLALGVVVIATPVVALVSGPNALWSGIASLALVVVTVAVLGLTHPGRVPSREESIRTSPWGSTFRRALQIVVLTAFALALAAVWDIDLFGRANAQFGESSVLRAMTAAVTLVLAYLTWEVIRTALDQSAIRTPSAQPAHEGGAEVPGTRLQTFAPLLRNFLFVVVITVATLVCLDALGVNITPLLAGAGVIGIALGFGAQTLVRDVISGVFFLAEDAFRIGEHISIGNTRGTVEGIAIRSLRLRHHRGPVHTVPFGEIKQLTNYSRDWIIMKLEFLLAFDTDLKKVKKLVKEIGNDLEAHPELGHAVIEPLKSQGVRRMEPAGMVVVLKFMGKPGSEVYALRREIYHRVRDAFEQNGIRFARPEVLFAGSGDTTPGAALGPPATRLAGAP